MASSSQAGCKVAVEKDPGHPGSANEVTQSGYAWRFFKAYQLQGLILYLVRLAVRGCPNSGTICLPILPLTFSRKHAGVQSYLLFLVNHARTSLSLLVYVSSREHGQARTLAKHLVLFEQYIFVAVWVTGSCHEASSKNMNGHCCWNLFVHGEGAVEFAQSAGTKFAFLKSRRSGKMTCSGRTWTAEDLQMESRTNKAGPLSMGKQPAQSYDLTVCNLIVAALKMGERVKPKVCSSAVAASFRCLFVLHAASFLRCFVSMHAKTSR